MSKFKDVREILRYVRDFRGQVFVVCIDDEIVFGEGFGNVLLDIALLHSLNIRVVLVHGVSFQLRRLAAESGRQVSSDDGTGVTDPATFDLVLNAANRVTHHIFCGLAKVDLRAACTNAIVAHPAGILKGIDMQLTGRVERIDAQGLRRLLEDGSIPVLSPLGFDGEGHSFRLSADALAVEVAVALKATKIVYVTPSDGVLRSGVLLRQIPAAEARRILSEHRDEIPREMARRLDHACNACARGVQRVHMINGHAEAGVLAEVFSNQGVGTLVYDDEYEVIRPASKTDVPVILKLLRQAAERDEVMQVTYEEIEGQIDEFFVVEIDRNPVACAALRAYPGEEKVELARVVVATGHENYGIGRRLIERLENEARRRGFRELVCLSTQAFNYFKQKAGFLDGTADDLPSARRVLWASSGRNSRILKKALR